MSEDGAPSQRHKRTLAQSLNEKGNTNRNIAQALDVCKRTVQRWRKISFRPSLPRGRPVKHSVDTLGPLIQSFMEERTGCTIDQIRTYLSTQHDISCSRMTISRLLSRDGSSLDRASTSSKSESDREEMDFRERLDAHNGALYALDEAMFDRSQFSSQSLSPRKRRKTQQGSERAGQRFSLMLCVQRSATDPVVGWKLMEGGLTADKFHSFLSDLPLERKAMLVLDNARIHKPSRRPQTGKTTIADLALQREIQLNYLPSSYSTVEPVEHCFERIRRRVKDQNPETDEALCAAIEEGVHELANMEADFMHTFRDFSSKIKAK